MLRLIQKLKVPKIISGRVDMIIGIKFANLFPELIHQFPNGLSVYRSKLLPATREATTCLAGPVEALNCLHGIFGERSVGFLTQFATSFKNYSPRLEFFPDDCKNLNEDIPGINMLTDKDCQLDLDNDYVSSQVNTRADCSEQNGNQTFIVDNNICIECGELDMNVNSLTIQSEMKKFMQHQEAGLDARYKCDRCRNCQDCIKGSGYERMSLKQEAEQNLIKESVHIDLDRQRAMARLPFKVDPRSHLQDNQYEAIKRLQNVTRKYSKDEKTKSEINAAFAKLRKKGHIRFYEDLAASQVEKLEAETGYHLPWDVVWKESSLSTPARTVYDASSKTKSGFSLNDVLATGVPDLARLLDVLLQWHIGPVAIVGDVSQFYCSIGLEEQSWPYQKLLLREDLNPNGKLIKAVIVSAIFGVCSSGGQSEEAIKKFCDLIKLEFPDVVKLLLKSRYVDDILKSIHNKEAAETLIKDTENVLKRIDMNIKGWAISGEIPPEQMTDDGFSVNFSGLKWYPVLDAYKLNISSLHFKKKKRGKHDSNVDVFDVDKHGTIDAFLVNKILSRRKCTSVCARIFDMFGKLEPVRLRLKHDLRQLIRENPDWDHPISPVKFARWTENFKIIQDCRDIMYTRCIVPENAINLIPRYWIFADASDTGIMLVVYVQFEVPGNKWSGSHLLGKSFLAPDDMTIPKKELSALNLAANIKVVLDRALDEYTGSVYVCGDSEISLAWVTYENVKLETFHRNRVNNIRSKVSLDNLHHVISSENCADCGTRPDLVSASSVMPGSTYLSGKKWMENSYDEIVASGIIKSVHDIKLSNDGKKALKEGIIYEQFDDDDCNVGVLGIYSININKVAEYEAYSKYIYPPMKRSFLPTVRILSYVFLAVRKFKEGGVKSAIRKGKADPKDLDKFKSKGVRFTTFQTNSASNLDQPLSQKFRVHGVQCNVEKDGKVKTILVRLSDEDLSVGLEYLFKKTTQEVLKFEKQNEVEKISTLKDEILYCTSRILESQEITTAGWVSEALDLQTFTGVKFYVPVISRHSPIGVSLALHMHYNVHAHKGAETTFRMCLQHARILKGKQLFKDIADDCLFCKKLRQVYVRKLMGPLSDKQLCISPLFYFVMMDLWGPISIYCPGYEKKTRARKQEYQMHLLVMGCVVTGCVNVQVIEKRNTGGILDGLNRFFNEACVPKIAYPDQDGAMMKALDNGEISLLDLQGNLHKQRGIMFECCLPQGHYQHGRIERRIRSLQESLDRSNIRNSRCTALGWQCIAKAIERECNNVPIGFLHHQGTANPLLRVLSPSLLKNGTFTDRAPCDLFTIPDSSNDIMTNIASIYNLWFQIWNTSYVPLIMDRPKWLTDDDNLRPQDLVFFKLTDSAISADWRLGKVEFTTVGKDGKVRNVGISYKVKSDDDDQVSEGWKHSVVERPSRSVVKLCNVEDTSLIEDMENAHKLAKKMLDKEGTFNSAKSVNSKIIDSDKVDAIGRDSELKVCSALKSISGKFIHEELVSAEKYSGILMNFMKMSSDVAPRYSNFTTSSTSSKLGSKTNAILDNVTEKMADEGNRGLLSGGEGQITDIDVEENDRNVYLM